MARGKIHANGLTAKQEKFCIAYNKCANASEAYRSAYDTARMKPESVNQLASRLLNKVGIASRIAALRSGVAERAEVSTAEVLQEAARIALCDPTDLFNANGEFLAMADWPLATRRAVASIKRKPEYSYSDGERKLDGYATEVRFWDKNAALEKLMKHLGMYEKDNLQRATPFDKMPRQILELIENKLNDIAGTRPDVAEYSDAATGARVLN